jgi:gamma-glutamyl hercynylcysteine S-oxide synthase
VPLGLVTALDEARTRTLKLVEHLDEAQLEAVIDPIMSPLAWDLGHIAAFEDLWLAHRAGGLPLLRPGFAELYDAFETPRAVRGDIEFLRGDELREYLADVRERIRDVPYGDGVLHELVLRHELQHTETMLQTMALGDLLPPDFTGPEPVSGDGLDMVEIPAGPVDIGAPAEGFAYDNERPRHRVDVRAFRIARTPVTNAAWLEFTDDPGARAGHPDAPVVHVSWFEAEAFARAHGARLATEFEWEKAAAAGRLEAIGRVWEWTASPFRAYPGFRAYPYREYSEPFFGDGYKVLRGWSCATHPRVGALTFRNWDLPQRRQLFAGVRLAR